MTPASELVECDNCDCLFAAASVDEIFYHATARCRRDVALLSNTPSVDA
jgi:uncharacterized paraquat-inducible protein A